jgi:hypothetical protein
MEKKHYRYVFGWDLPLEEVEATLRMALVATECLHGSAQVTLEANYRLDLKLGICEIQASNHVERDLNRLFTGMIQREFGEASFWVECLGETSLDSSDLVSNVHPDLVVQDTVMKKDHLSETIAQR